MTAVCTEGHTEMGMVQECHHHCQLSKPKGHPLQEYQTDWEVSLEEVCSSFFVPSLFGSGSAVWWHQMSVQAPCVQASGSQCYLVLWIAVTHFSVGCIRQLALMSQQGTYTYPCCHCNYVANIEAILSARLF